MRSSDYSRRFAEIWTTDPLQGASQSRHYDLLSTHANS